MPMARILLWAAVAVAVPASALLMRLVTEYQRKRRHERRRLERDAFLSRMNRTLYWQPQEPT